jgi:hypothetical protein
VATVGCELAGSIEDVAPCPWLAVVIVALAAGLACLPAAVVITGMPGPIALGLGLVGTALSGLKVVLMIYGIGKLGLGPSPAD